MAEWTHSIEDGMIDEDNVIKDGTGKVLIIDTPYYPHVDLDLEQWKLVAAAPELLKALQEVDDCIDLTKHSISLYDMVRSAISKATLMTNEG